MSLRAIGGSAGVFLVPALVLIFLGFDVPLLLMLGRSVTDPEWGLQNFHHLFSEAAYVRILGQTARIAVETTLLCAAIGFPLAYWMSQIKGVLRTFAILAVVLPFWISILVRTFAWVAVLGADGPVNHFLAWCGIDRIEILYTETGVLVGTVNVLLPFYVLPVFAAMIRVDARVLQAAEVLGGTRRDVFWRVFFPIARPALVGASLLVFILSFGFFVTPAVLGGGRFQMLATLLDGLVNRFPNWGLASALCAMLLLLAVMVYVLSERASGVKSGSRKRVA
jgi:putative spermidine/putrescine transport system permease protein